MIVKYIVFVFKKKQIQNALETLIEIYSTFSINLKKKSKTYLIQNSLLYYNITSSKKHEAVQSSHCRYKSALEYDEVPETFTLTKIVLYN